MRRSRGVGAATLGDTIRSGSGDEIMSSAAALDSSRCEAKKHEMVARMSLPCRALPLA